MSPSRVNPALEDRSRVNSSFTFYTAEGVRGRERERERRAALAMKLSLIAQARGWCLQNKTQCRRWAFRRLYSCNSEHEDEMNHTEPTNYAEKETTPMWPPAELSKKKRGSSLNHLQSRLSMLEANILRALLESSKEMTELRAEVVKVCEDKQQETVKGFDEVDVKMELLREKITGLIRDVETQKAAEETKQEKVKGLEEVINEMMEIIDEKVKLLIGNVRAFEFNYSNDWSRRTSMLESLKSELQTGEVEWQRVAAKKMEKVQEVVEELVRKMAEQHEEIVEDLLEKVARKTAEGHEEVVRKMEALHDKVVEKMEEQCKEVKELLCEKVASMMEMSKPKQDFELSQIGTAEWLGLVVKNFELIECKLSVLSEKFRPGDSELGRICSKEPHIPCEEFRSLTLACYSELVSIIEDSKGLSETSKRLRLWTKDKQEKHGVQSDASSGKSEKYLAKMEDLMQGVQEELQGLCVLLAQREKGVSAHRVAVDNQQMDASKRIWDELRLLQENMSWLELELRNGTIKRFDQKQVRSEDTTGNDRANAVLVTISGALLACSTAICVWTLQIW
ncbi:hypothetical protein GOP47_0023096 [Adiantum capillus-veneris]|uniref:Uncharacterized protein n=1 Tax=Adiantum capillus-veneris TaxID=13818 RepID=A0A9D4Z6M1_ADICA|nr:hypothetical protein GOP47_0023096 [Adiantum capillus-veneris]